jgi:hydroxylamine oxidation protein HaoB
MQMALAGLGGLAALAAFGLPGLTARITGSTVPPVELARAAAPDTAIGDAARALASRLSARAEAVTLSIPPEARAIGTMTEAITPGGARVVLDWQPATQPPLLMREVHAEEELRLVEAMAKHLPDGASVLAMPATSARLSALTAARWPLAGAAAFVLAPGAGADQAAALRAFAGADAPADPEADAAARALVEALLSEDAGGAARLRVLAGTGEAYALVHLHDAFALGLIRDGALPMLWRNFTATGFSHDLAREAKAEVALAGHAAYAIDRNPEGNLRGHFLTRDADTATLIAQLLPFDTSRLGEVPGMVLVYQTGGYWLYRIAPVSVGD